MDLTFNRTGWPKSGAVIQLYEIDLQQLWTTHPDQVRVFIAEALIDEPPTLHMDIYGDIKIGLWVWEVAGQQITVHADLIEALQFAFECEQPGAPEEIANCLAGLEKLKEAVDGLITDLQNRGG